jgi:hypothetical protein
LPGNTGFAEAILFSWLFDPDVFWIFEGQERHEIGVVHNESLGRALDQIALPSVGGDDVTNGIWHAAFQRQSDSGKGVAQSFPALTLPRFSVRTDFVFQQLANVR